LIKTYKLRHYPQLSYMEITHFTAVLKRNVHPNTLYISEFLPP
jgi:hypothetical protein